MKLFMIRWQNGSTSLIGAPTKDEAMHFADCEWGDPYSGAEVTELKRFAMDLEPRIIEGRLEFDANLGPFGGPEAFHSLPAKAYPLIEELKETEIDSDVRSDAEDAEWQSKMEETLKAELERVKSPQTNTQKTPLEQAMGWAAGSPISLTYGIPPGTAPKEKSTEHQ